MSQQKKIIPPGMKLAGIDLGKLDKKNQDPIEKFREYTNKNVEILFSNQTELFRRTKDLLEFLNTLNENIIAVARMLGLEPKEFITKVYEKEANLEYMKVMEEIEQPLIEAKKKAQEEQAAKEMEEKAEELKEPGTPTMPYDKAVEQFGRITDTDEIPEAPAGTLPGAINKELSEPAAEEPKP